MIRLRYVLLAAAGVLPVLSGWSAWSASPAPTHAVGPQATALFSAANDFWSQEFSSLGGQYQPATLALFRQQVRGACDTQAALTGSFYCPADQRVYLDQTFLEQVAQRADGASDLALAYIIGHEIGHHVQYLSGTTALVEQARSRSAPALSARTWSTAELQADCYAGLWMRSAAKRGRIQRATDASVAPALEAVTALSEQWSTHLAAGHTMADPFTRSAAAQRLKWFERGLDSGDAGACNTFRAAAAGQL